MASTRKCLKAATDLNDYDVAEFNAYLDEGGSPVEAIDNVIDDVEQERAALVKRISSQGGSVRDRGTSAFSDKLVADAIRLTNAEDIKFSRNKATGNLGVLATENVEASRAVQRSFDRMDKAEADRLKGELEANAGTPWAAVTVKSLVLKDIFHMAMQGETNSDRMNALLDNPLLWGKSDLRASSIIKAFLTGNQRIIEGEIATYDFFGKGAKAELDVSGSYANCAPSRECAKHCYAADGTGGATSGLIKGEFTEFAAENFPDALVNNIATKFKGTHHYFHDLMLRWNEKGDLSDAQANVIRDLNKQGIFLQVFSKRPDVLRTLDDRNLKMLSVDKSNLQVADMNPDLRLAVTITDELAAKDIEGLNDRVSVYLPVNLKGKSYSKQELQAQFPDIVKRMNGKVCPVEIGYRGISKDHKFVNIVVNKTPSSKDYWTCASCNATGVACFKGGNFKESGKASEQYISANNIPVVRRKAEAKASVNDLFGMFDLLKKQGDLDEQTHKQLLEILNQSASDIQSSGDGRGIPEDSISYSRASGRDGQAAKQSERRIGQAAPLNNALANYFQDTTWETAYEEADLPDAFSEFTGAAEIAFGSKIVAVNPTTREAEQFNGVNVRGTNFVNVANNVSILNVAGHEMYHDLERRRPDLHAWLTKNARQYYKDIAAYTERLNKLVNTGENEYSTQAAESELLADFMGDALSDPVFLKQLADRDASKFQQLLNAVRNFLNSAIAKLKKNSLDSSKEFKDLEAMRRLLSDVLVAYANDADIAEVAVPRFAQPAFQRAYHGTPYTFDAFSLSKINSGQGAQQFGWGLYFASDKGVAEWYKEALGGSGRERLMVDGKVVEHDALPEDEMYVLDDIADHGYEKTAEIYAQVHKPDSPYNAVLKKYKGRSVAYETGSVYEVEIPDKDELLLWDKPLSKQPAGVRKAIEQDALFKAHKEEVLANRKEYIRKFNDGELDRLLNKGGRMADRVRKNVSEMTAMGNKYDPRGSQLYNIVYSAKLSANPRAGIEPDAGDDRAASMYLNEMGIKGLTYEDAGAKSMTMGFEGWLFAIKGESVSDIVGTDKEEAYDREYADFVLRSTSANKDNFVIWDEAAISIKAVNDQRRQAEQLAMAFSRKDMHFKDVAKRVPELTEASSKVRDGQISLDDYDSLIDKVKPVEPFDRVPEPASFDEMYNALDSRKREKIDTPVADGERVGLRLDIPAYTGSGVWVPTIHAKGITSHRAAASVRNVSFGDFDSKALKVASGATAKSPFAKIEGDFVNAGTDELVRKAKLALRSKDWIQVGMDPERHGYFYNRANHREQVTGAEEVIQIGALVLAKNPAYGDRGGLKFKRASEEDITETAAFKRWAGTDAPVIEADAINDYKFKDGETVVMRAYHGTTHDFNTFDASISGNKEGHYGAVNYFTSNYDDAYYNYGSEGVDLQNRIEQRKEALEQDMWDWDEEDLIYVHEKHGYPWDEDDRVPEGLARDIAESELKGDGEKVMELFIRSEKPFVTNTDDSPWIEFADFEALQEQAIELVADNNGIEVEEVMASIEDYEDEIDEARWDIQSEEDNALTEAIRDVADAYGFSADDVLADLVEHEVMDETTMAKLEQALRDSDTLADYIDYDTNTMAGAHILAEVIREMGYDSIILKNANRRFGGMNMIDGTAHIHVFDANNTNIKSATDNNGEFDSDNADIRFSRDAGYKGFNKGEAYEWMAAKQAGLDMSKDARLKRAKQLGFDTEQVWYHGTKKSLKSLNTSMGSGTFLSDSGNVASSYAAGDANVMPIYVQKQGRMTVHVGGRQWDRIDEDAVVEFYGREMPLYEALGLQQGYNTTTDDIARAAREAGFKSLLMKGVADLGVFTDSMVDPNADPMGDIMVVFDSTAMRSTNAAFNPDFAESDNLLFSRNREYPANDSTGFTVPDETWLDVIIRKMQDKFKTLKDVQFSIKKAGGIVTEASDAYIAEELYHGKAENDLRLLQDDYVQPMAEAMAANGVTQDELDLYLRAKHAKERNDYVASIREDMPDGGSGMTNAEAQRTLDQFDADGKTAGLEQVSDYVYTMLQDVRDKLRNSDLADDETIDAWETSYQHYVPLRGFADDEGGKTASTGRGFNTARSLAQRVTGRKSESASPSAMSVIAATEMLIKIRKNEVAKSFLQLVQDNPNQDLWEVFTEDNPEKQIKNTKRADGSREVKEMAVPMAMFSDQYFTAKVNGKTHYIRIHSKRAGDTGDRLMRAMKNVGGVEMNGLIRGLSAITRLMSALNTSYSPQFMFTNFTRDVQTAVLNLKAEQSAEDGKLFGEEIATKVVKDLGKSMKAIYAAIRGTDGGDPEWRQYFDEFREAGAQTGYFDMRDIEAEKRHLSSLVEMSTGTFKGNAMKFGRTVTDFVEDLNRTVENGVRLSAYYHARKAGASKTQAASLAKNMTVNFNRKGEIGTTLNALYMFANASIQGTANFVRTMGMLKGDKTLKWRNLNNAQKIAVAVTAGTFFLSMANRAAAGEDDDGENFYDKIPDYVKERNIVFMKSLFGGADDGSYIKIPMPYGYNVFGVLGDAMEALLFSPEKKADQAARVVLAVAGSFSPIGFSDSETGYGLILKNITPTVMKPVVDIGLNENYFGTPIYREPSPFGIPEPDSSLSKRTTPEAYKKVAEFLNDVTGGSQYRTGAIDVNPDVMRYIVDYFGGAAYSFFGSKVPDTVHRAVSGAEVEAHRVPFVNSFYGQVEEYESISKYYDRRREVGQYAKEYKNLTGSDKTQFQQQYGKLLWLDTAAKQVDKKLRALRGERDTAYQSDMSFADRDRELKRIEMEMKKITDKFNASYLAAQKTLLGD